MPFLSLKRKETGEPVKIGDCGLVYLLPQMCNSPWSSSVQRFPKPFWNICTGYALTTRLWCQKPSPVASVIHPTGSTDKEVFQHSTQPPTPCSFGARGSWGHTCLQAPSLGKTNIFLATLAWIVPHGRPLSAVIWFLFYCGPFHRLVVIDELPKMTPNGQQRHKPLFCFTVGVTSSVQS